MKKIPIIRPLLIDDNFVTYIQMKANIFNKFFAEQCTPLKNSTVFPANQIFLTQSRLNSINFKKRRNPQDYKSAKYTQGAWSNSFI